VLLASRGDLNVGVLADALGIHPSSATRLCNRLVAKGLVERAPAAGSRREVTVALSADGHKLLRAVTARRRAEIKRVVARLRTSERQLVIDAFAAFAAAAEEVPDDAWKLGWTD